MKLNLLLFYGIIIPTMVACKESPPPQLLISDMQWLIGSWQGTYMDKPFYEAWRKLDDSTMINFAIEIVNGDTLVNENGMIRVNSKRIYYQSKHGQWKLIRGSDAALVFSNDTLSFSNEIHWSHADDGHWLTDLTQKDHSKVHYDLVPVSWPDPYIDADMAKVK